MAQPALAARARDRGGRHGDPCRCAALALRHHTAARPRRRRAKAIDRKGLAGKSSERQPAEGAVGDADGIGLHSAGRQSKDMMPRTLAAVNLALAAVAALLVLYIGRQFVAPTSLPVGGRRAAAPTASAAAIETARSPASAYNVV